MVYVNTNELYHHGIKGQKWGIRRFQNPDGTLTQAGRKRYMNYDGSYKKKKKKSKAKQYEKQLNKLEKEQSIRNTDYSNHYQNFYINSRVLSKIDIGSKKAAKLMQQNEYASIQMKDLEKKYDIGSKQIADLINKISNDSDVIWGTSETFYDGKTTSGLYDGSYGTHFKVRSSSNKNREKIERNKDFYQHTPYHNNYYF